MLISAVLGLLVSTSNGSQDANPQASLSQSAEHWNQASRQQTQEVALDVSQAWTDLRALQSSSSRSWRINKRSGLVGSTVYYAKKGFVLLFMNAPHQSATVDSSQTPAQLSKPLEKAVRSLERAADIDDPDALFLLAEMNFYGNFTHPRNYQEAFKRYKQLATSYGNTSAQHMVGFFYATGLGDAVQRDQGKALLYHTFAAKGGDIRSEMTLGYRHHTGVGASKDCNEAAIYYKRAADKAVEWARSGPPGGLSLPRDAHRIADEQGGVYGDGASFSSSGANSIQASPNSDQNAAFDDMMEYLDLMSRKGDIKATFNLARLYYEGSKSMNKSYRSARQHFLMVARKYWSSDDKVINEDTMGTGRLAAKAAAYIGRMYLRAEGVEQNFAKALRWFKLGVSNGEAISQYELGLMYLHGHGLQKDAVIAADYFKAAAKQDWPAAQVQLGKLFLDQGDLSTALNYFEFGARHGHIEAIYHLAEINNNGVGRARSCGLATAYYKLVVEKAEPLHSSWEEANGAYEEGDLETALVAYMMAAEQGYEQAQANVAFLLDEQKSILPLDGILPWTISPLPILQNAVLALIYWTRSARQANIDSTVKMGDYYFNGYGVQRDLEKAATCYTAAAEMQQSALAQWNLGWLHENGYGVEQDYHLAMRYYIQALNTNSESYLPVMLSIYKVRIRNWWNHLVGGKVNPIHPEPGWSPLPSVLHQTNKPELADSLTWKQWFSKLLENGHDSGQRTDNDEEIDTRFYESIPGGDDYYPEDIEDGFIESLVIVTLAGALALLVYYRQQRQQARRRLEAEQRRRQQLYQAGGVQQDSAVQQEEPMMPGQHVNGGFFPPPDDPNFDAWRVGGVGH